MKLRYFTPKELLALHGFPNTFEIPNHFTIRQCYKFIGNSLSIFVVKELLKYLLSEKDKDEK